MELPPSITVAGWCRNTPLGLNQAAAVSYMSTCLLVHSNTLAVTAQTQTNMITLKRMAALQGPNNIMEHTICSFEEKPQPQPQPQAQTPLHKHQSARSPRTLWLPTPPSHNLHSLPRPSCCLSRPSSSSSINESRNQSTNQISPASSSACRHPARQLCPWQTPSQQSPTRSAPFQSWFGTPLCPCLPASC